MIGGIIRTVRDAAAILRDLGYEVAGEAAAFLLRNVNGSPSPPAGPPLAAAAESGERSGGVPEDPEDLRKAFARLLERSREARGEPPLHPAFRAILDEITPDEARILRLFDEREEQPLVHVKAIPKYGFGATIVVENFTLVGEEAGCHHPELAPSYVDNLCRLGVLRIHEGRGSDREAYDLLEVHPVVKSAARRIRDETGQRMKLDRKLLRLTPLGRRFCDTLTRDGVV